ncbi:MAG: TetR/AcrR family transcriptional regulator [bacterium]
MAPDETAVDPRVARSRAAILQATAELLIEQGSAGVTIEGIADRSKVAKTTIYRHWKSRSQLVFDAFESLLRPGPAVPPSGTLRTQLQTILSQLSRGVTVSEWAPAISALIEAGDRDPELRQLIHDFLLVRMEHGRDALRAAQRRAELREDIDIDVAIGVLVGPIFYRRLVSREPLTDAVVAEVVDQFLRSSAPVQTAELAPL